MKTNRRRIGLSVLPMISLGNYLRMQNNENSRTTQFLSIFSVGMLFGLFVKEIIDSFKNKQTT